MTDGVSSRRAFLLGGIGAALVTALRPVTTMGATGESFTLGVENQADAVTRLAGKMFLGADGEGYQVLGVTATGDTGRALSIDAIGTETVGIETRAPTGVALSVNGRAVFSGAGRTSTVRRNKRSVTVSNVGLHTYSVVLATVNSAAAAVGVQRVSLDHAHDKVTIYLTAVAPSPVKVAWFHFET